MWLALYTILVRTYWPDLCFIVLVRLRDTHVHSVHARAIAAHGGNLSLRSPSSIWKDGR